MASINSPSSRLLITALLALLCTIAVVVLRSNTQHNNQTNTSNLNSNSAARIAVTRQTKQQSSLPDSNNNMKQGRTMVGGYSAQKSNELLSSPEVAEIANFALAQHAAGASNFGNNNNEVELENTLNLVVLPEEVESGVVLAKVLEAQQQVVAGLNYKLTIAILKKNNNNSNNNIPTCLGAMKVVVYKPLPHTGLPLSVTSWGGRALSCEEVKELMVMDDEDDIQQMEEEEETATRVEEEIKDETEEVEPDA